MTLYNIDNRQRILLMGNDRDMLMLLNRTLELEGFDTCVITDYHEALSLIEELKPDLIIMDTYLPDISVLKILDTMRSLSDVPIVVITADHEPEMIRTVLEHGADDYIRKPFGIKPFIARIKAKVRRYRGEVLTPF